MRHGNVAAYDFEIPVSYRVHGPARRQRVFLLVDEHIQLNQPLTFFPPRSGWWYVDLVEIDVAGDHLTVVDHWIDVLVPPPGQPYRVIDIDEFADAMHSGQLPAGDAIDGLRRLQAFLDRHLHGSRDDPHRYEPRDRWPDFPPAALDPLLDVSIPLHHG